MTWITISLYNWILQIINKKLKIISFVHHIALDHNFIFQISTPNLLSQTRAPAETACISCKFPWNRWIRQSSTICFMVCTSPHWQSGESEIFHLCSRNAQQPWPVLILFKRSHVRRSKSKPSTAIVGSTISSLLCTSTAFHNSFQRDFRSFKLSMFRKKTQNGDRDFSLKFVGADIKSL